MRSLSAFSESMQWILLFIIISLHDTAVHVSTQMVLFEKAQFSGQPYEIYRDLADATSLQLSHLISVMVVRGWYVLILFLFIFLPGKAPRFVTVCGVFLATSSLCTFHISHQNKTSKLNFYEALGNTGSLQHLLYIDIHL